MTPGELVLISTNLDGKEWPAALAEGIRRKWADAHS